ncbi:MAG: hypothetical protein KDA33_07200 [Phycisphaerales bacterium]|nr:hypothetical protein [Phycisphaerales bacterium]
MSEAPVAATPRPGSKAPLIVVLLLVVAGAGAWYFVGGSKSRIMTREGVVTYVDYANRTAELELPDPKGGTPMTVPAEIAETCKVSRGGKPLSVNDIQVGDRVRVKAEYERRKMPDGSKEPHYTAIEVELLEQGS